MRTKSISRRSFVSTALLAGSAGLLSSGLTDLVFARQSAPPNLEEWLNAHPNVRDAIFWYFPKANSSQVEKHPYTAWISTHKKSLQQAFEAAWKGYLIQMDDPPVNLSPPNQYPATVLKPIDAFGYFLDGVGHSLAVEIGGRVPWSIQNYSASNLATLFDGSWIFSYDISLQGMRIHAGNNGYYTPSPTQLVWNFLKGIGVFAPPDAEPRNRRPVAATPGISGQIKLPPSPARLAVARLFDWCRTNLVHANESGDPSTAQMNAIWQYSGFPPLSRVIGGTVNKLITSNNNPSRNWTGGCIGTTGFLSGVLRTINVPVKHVQSCKHSLPVFPTLNAALSHGDDLYDSLVRPGGSNPALPFPSTELFISSQQFDSWFGPSAADPCANVSRRTAELGRQHLPYAVMIAFCQDKKSQAAKANGKVFGLFKKHFTLPELEATDLWGRAEKKLAAGFDCGGYL